MIAVRVPGRFVCVVAERIMIDKQMDSNPRLPLSRIFLRRTSAKTLMALNTASK